MILFFEPVLKETIWGGNRLKDFGYNLPSEKIGECWGISAHPNGQSIVKNGPHKGKNLEELWENNRELFGNLEGDKFPLLIKIIDANEDLSVQVHPDDKYAIENENGELGKTECWYILDAKENADMIYGINAKNKDELNDMIDNKNWESLLKTVSIKSGDFFYIPSGTVHAIKSGTLLLEVQQNSDTTYRLYDYDRKDDSGNLRELHIEKSKDVIDLSGVNSQIIPKIETHEEYSHTKFLKSDFFGVEKYEINGKMDLINTHPFILMSVIDGNGILSSNDETYPLKKGDHLMISSDTKKISINGNLKIISSYI